MRISTKAFVPVSGAVSLLTLTAPGAWANEGHPPTPTSAGSAAVGAVLRCLVLVGSAMVRGAGLLRPMAGQPSRITRLVTLLAVVALLASMVVTGAARALFMPRRCSPC